MSNRLTLASMLLIALAASPLGCKGRKDVSRQESDGRSVTSSITTSDASAIPAEHLDQIIELFNQGVGHMDRHQPSQAVEAFDKVVQLAPHWTTGRLNLAIALLNSQSDEAYVRAEQELNLVIRDEPENVSAHYSLGMLLMYLGRLDAAIPNFQRVLEIDPQDGDTHYQLGVLLAERDPGAARLHLEAALETIPHHAGACYRLQSLLRQAGESQEATELLNRFQALKNSGAGVTSGMKYGEMGRYAEVVRAFHVDFPQDAENSLPVYEDVAERTGLRLIAGGVSGWPGNTGRNFGPGVAAADVDGDQDLDLFIPSGKPGGGVSLFLSSEGSFAASPESGIDDRDAIGAYFGDYDRDGDEDLFVTCRGPNRLYQNDGHGRFTDVTQASGTAGMNVLSLGAAWADADHDGDLDLYVANHSPADDETAAGARNVLWRNNGNGTFTDVAVEAGVDGGVTASVGVLFFDVDDDRDLDLYVINHGSPNRLFLNDRVGEYREATSQYEALADDGPGLGGVLGDVDGNGRLDLLLIRGTASPRLFLQLDRGKFVEDHAFEQTIAGIEGAAGGLFGDLDLDGDLDLVLLAAGRADKTGHQVFTNRGEGRFEAAGGLGPQDRLPDAQGALAVDLDGDGGLELVVARAGATPELWRAPASPDQHWLEVLPGGSDQTKAFPTTIGMQVEIKSGFRLQVAGIAASSGYLGGTPARAHFGLGRHAKADYVRLAWPDGVLQSELEVSADQAWHVAKVERKPSCCPVLFSWDGERFAFVTDFLGVGGLGFFVSPRVYAPPDPTEDVRIPPHLVKPRDGRYLLRVVEPLEEVAYLDELSLLVYDHPEAWEIYPDERFTGTPPFATGRPLAVAEKVFPVAASDHHGQDVLPRISAIDRLYVEPPASPQFIGYADDHWVELDFGDRLQQIPTEAKIVLYLYGWVEYTYSHVNYAAYQAGLTMRSPAIEVPNGAGGWQTVMAEAGFPAGLPRMMTVDISSLPVRQSGRLRIRTNMEVFWDQIFASADVAGDRLAVHRLEPLVAELRPVGYPREYSPDGRSPAIYDYHRADQGLAFKNLSGDFTRFGDVRPLLSRVDDKFVIMGRGEEVALEFDADRLPALPVGWFRTLVLHADGYCKDMDLYTAMPDTVDPLPFHGMENYPPLKPAPASGDDLLYRSRWNTRRVAGH